MKYINNKYTTIYYKIIDRARQENRTKIDGFYSHHVIPKSLGGTNDPNNLVLLTYKEHRVCHCLLIKMVEDTNSNIKMRHAYGFFNKNSVFNGPRYRKGKENVFARPEIIAMVRERMKNNNPMKNPEIQARRLASWKAKRAAKDIILPRILKDKFITPLGVFKTKKEVQKVLGLGEWITTTIYDNLDNLPVSNGRRSRKIDNLSIDYSKTWRENGFDVIDKNSTKNSSEV
jgi:hypothetical protein